MTLKVRISPVPKPLFGINLRSALKRSGWAALRESLIRERGRRCGTCGSAVKKPSDLQAHEEWAFDTSKDPAVATISRIVVQCRMCHGCEHFFRTLILAKNALIADWQVEDLIKHFCAVNGVGRDDFDEHALHAWNEWKRLSALRWQVDLRPYSKAVIDADPAPDIKALNSRSKLPWDDPADGERRSEFLYLLTQLSTRYGYWIGRTSKKGAIPLYVMEPGTGAGEYCISRTLVADTSGTGSAPHTLSWSEDPVDVQARSKRRRGRR